MSSKCKLKHPKWLKETAVPLSLKKEPGEEEQRKYAKNAIGIKKEPSIRTKKEPAAVVTVPKTRKRKAAWKPKTEPSTPSSVANPPQKRKRKQEPETWITESRDFSTGVVDDILYSLYSNLQRTEHLQLARLQAVWAQKFNPMEHKPESNRTATPPPPKRIYKPRKKKTPLAKGKGCKPATLNEDEENVVNSCHWGDLEDNEIVENQICVPPLKNKFSCRKFNIMMPAFALKRNLIQPLFNLKLLERIMAPPLEEGTKILQHVVDEMLHQYLQE